MDAIRVKFLETANVKYQNGGNEPEGMYTISMISLPERCYIGKENLKKMGFSNPNIFHGLKSVDLPIEDLIRHEFVSPDFVKSEMEHDEVARHLSHLAVLSDFLKCRGENWRIVLEGDEIGFPTSASRAGSQMKTYIKKLEVHQDKFPVGIPQIHFLAYCDEESDISNRPQEAEGIVKAKNPACVQAYAINKSAAREILKNTVPITSSSSQMFMDLLKNSTIRGYCNQEGSILVKNSDSTKEIEAVKRIPTEPIPGYTRILRHGKEIGKIGPGGVKMKEKEEGDRSQASIFIFALLQLIFLLLIWVGMIGWYISRNKVYGFIFFLGLIGVAGFSVERLVSSSK